MVNKTTSKVFFLTYLEDTERFDAMTPEGEHPSEEDPVDY